MQTIITVLLLLTLHGCVAAGTPSITTVDIDATIQRGHSTKSDVLALLGQPLTRSTSQGYGQVIEVWNYTHSAVDVHPATFIPIIGLFAGGSTVNAKSVTITFSQDGIVSAVQQHTTTAESTLGGVRAQ